jgi:hypothetical protein
VLLRGNAVNYLVSGQDASGLHFGDMTVEHPPVIDADITGLLNHGVAVHYVKEDAETRGISEKAMIEGAKAVSRQDLPALLDGFEQVWHW